MENILLNGEHLTPMVPMIMTHISTKLVFINTELVVFFLIEPALFVCLFV